MKPFISKTRSKGYTPIYDEQHNQIGGYKWTEYYTSIEIYVENGGSKGCICIYVTPRPNESEEGYTTEVSQYVAYLPALDWFVEILQNDHTNWGTLFKTIPKTAILVKNSFIKEHGDPFLSQALDVTSEYEGYFPILGIYVNIPYPKEDEVMDTDEDDNNTDIDRFFEATDAIVEELENFDRDYGKTNWKSFFWNVGKIALAVFVGAELSDALDLDLDMGIGGDDLSGCDITPDMNDYSSAGSQISFCGIDNDIDYYQHMVNISSEDNKAVWLEKLKDALAKAGKPKP